MLLELKTIEDYLQEQLRLLLRRAKKENVHLVLITHGKILEQIHLNNLSTGPLARISLHQLHIYAAGESDTWSSLKVDFNIEEPLPIDDLVERILHDLAEGLEMAAPLDEDAEWWVEDEPPAMDEELITLDTHDWLDHFRSRYLIDAPRKMLYEAQLEKGLHYYGRFSEHCPLFLRRSTFFRQTVQMRTPGTHIRLEDHGSRLREMWLSPVRRLLQPFWQTRTQDTELVKLPPNFVLGPPALYHLAKALSRGYCEVSNSFWSWLKVNPGDTEEPLPNLPLSEKALTHPIGQAINDTYATHVHPPGEFETPLHNVLMGEMPFEEAVYIQDIEPHFSRDRVTLVSLGHALWLRKCESPRHQLVHPAY